MTADFRIVVTSVALVICLLLASVLYAEECTEALVVKEPCEGTLVPTEEAVEALKCLEVNLPRALAEHKFMSSKHKTYIQYHQDVVLSYENKVSALESKLLAFAAPTPWFKKQWVGWLGGAAAGSGTVLFAGFYSNEGIRWTGLGLAGTGVATLFVLILLD